MQQTKSSIPIPVSLSQRPKASNGYVIPFVQLILDNGQPDFRIHDLDKVLVCIKQRKCALCGEKMLGKLWFAGGEKCLEHRHFVDPPAHKKCMQYAFKVCPFLACPTSIYSNRSLPDIKGNILANERISQIRPKKLFAFETNNYLCEVFMDKQSKRVHEILLTAAPFTKIIEDKDFV